MRLLTLGAVTATLAALLVAVASPLPASATSSIVISAEVAGTTAPVRLQVQALRSSWQTQVTATHPGAVLETNVLTATTIPQAPATLFTASDGTSVAVEAKGYSAAAVTAATDTGTATTAQGTAICGSGIAGQGSSPRPSSLASAAANPCLLATVGYAYSQQPSTEIAGVRSGLVFTFSKPTAAFGAWFQDLETRTTGGRTAVVRLFGADGTLIGESTVLPTNESACTAGNNTALACGNATSRWIGFNNTATDRVSKMIVIVGDDDTNPTTSLHDDGRDEGIGFIGATIATFPELTLTKSVTAGYPINLGTGAYDVRYNLTLLNSGATTVTSLGLVDDLGATFSTLPASSISVQSVAISGASMVGSSAVLNAGYDGTAVTQLLGSSAKLVALDSLTVTLTVRVTPGSSLGPFSNTASATGTSGVTTVTDAVDVPPSVTFSESPAITASKTVVSAVSNGDGTQTIDYSVSVANTGDVVVSDLDIVDSLSAAFGAQLQSTTAPVISTAPTLAASAVTANAAYTGVGDAHLVATTSTLAAGDSVAVTFSVTVAATSGAPGSNAVDVSAQSPASQSVTATSSVPVSFPFTGSVAITKVISGAPAPLTSEFPFTINCGIGGVFSPLVEIVSASTGASTVSAIPALSTCSISEGTLPVPPTGYSWTGTTYTATSVSVVDGAVTAVTVTNTLTRDTGSVDIAVSVVGGPVVGADATIPLELACDTAATTSLSISVVASAGSQLVPGILAPATCSIAVGTLPAAPSGYSWDAPDVTPASTTVAAGAIGTVQVTLALTRNVAEVVVDATVTGGPSGGVAANMSLSLTCDTTGVTAVSLPVVASIGTAQVTSIPAPATCTMTTGALSPPPTGYSWGTQTLSPSSFTLANGDGRVVNFQVELVANSVPAPADSGLASTGVSAIPFLLLAALLVLLGLAFAVVSRKRAPVA